MREDFCSADKTLERDRIDLRFECSWELHSFIQEKELGKSTLLADICNSFQQYIYNLPINTFNLVFNFRIQLPQLLDVLR